MGFKYTKCIYRIVWKKNKGKEVLISGEFREYFTKKIMCIQVLMDE